MSNPALENSIGGQADHVPVVLRFQELIDLRRGKTRIGPEIAPLHRGPVPGDHRAQHLTPALGGVGVAGPQGTPLQVAELVEHEERMVAGAAEVAIVGAARLLAVGRADAGVHVQHDPLTGRRACTTSIPFAPVRVSVRTSPAVSLRPRASSSSRQASSPPSDVTFVPWNSSLRRRSNTRPRAPSCASPDVTSIRGTCHRPYRPNDLSRIDAYGAVGSDVGIDCGAFSSGVKVSAQAARSTG